MQRPVLDPNTAAESAWPTQSIRVIDPEIRKFGYTPDEGRFLPGDVLLVTGTNEVAKLIKRVQERGGFDPCHARWTHAALYIGNGQLVEATPFGGIRVGQLAKTTFGRELLVRRVSNHLAMEDRYKVAINALTGLGRGYSLGSVVPLAWQALTGKLWQGERRPDFRSVTICSSLVRNAYSTAVYKDLVPGVTAVTWPADLSHTGELDDAEIGWVQIGS